MRRAFAAIVPLALVLAVVACGGGGGGATGAAGTSTETAGGGGGGNGNVKACLVSDVGRFNDKGFNQSQLQGLKRAGSELGIPTRPIESRAASDYIPNLSSCARQGYDVTISAGFLLADATETVAKKFPDQQFAITDYSVKGAPFNGQKNVTGLTYQANESGCLVGYLGALMLKQQGGQQMMSAVGGIKIPPVDIWIAGFESCAKRANPAVTIVVDYSQDFVAQDKCKEIALNQIAAGSQVVFNVAGQCGLGALGAAKQKGVWGIGVDVDQSFLGPHILTSGVKRVDVGVFDAIEAVEKGQIKGGTDLNFDLKNNGVGVGKISPKVPKEFVDRMNDLKQQIIAGKVKVPAALGKQQ